MSDSSTSTRRLVGPASRRTRNRRHQVQSAFRSAVDQIRRGVSLRVKMRYITEHDWGYAIGLSPIVRWTLDQDSEILAVELIGPNPEYAACGEIVPLIWMVDLTQFIDPIDEIEAISDHLIDHQVRFESPCECHPDERCSDCHLRERPCFAGHSCMLNDSSDTQSPVDVREEIEEIVGAWGLVCDDYDEGASCWSWQGRSAMMVSLVDQHVKVEFCDWVIEILTRETGNPFACQTICYHSAGDFGLLCHQIVSAFPRENSKLTGHSVIQTPTDGVAR